MSLSGSIIATVLFILKPFVRNRLPKSTQYYLWFVVLLALLIPIPQIAVLSSAQTPTITAIPVITATPAIPTISETVTRFAITQGEQAERLQGIAHLANTNTAAYMQQRSTIESPLTFLMTHFVTIYPFGVLFFSIWYIANYLFFIKTYRRHNIAAQAEHQYMLTQMCKGRKLRLYHNPLATTPMLMGLFRPIIILPKNEYTTEQLQAIFAHELTHLRRKDIFVKWLMLLASALHWFNPLVWLIRREIDRTCELSCDEAVIRNLSTADKQVYGNTLIEVSANTKVTRAVASVTMSEEKKNLKERLGAIMKSKRRTRTATMFSILLLLLAACSAVALGVGSGEENGNGTRPMDYVDSTAIVETTPENAPRLYASLVAGSAPVQRIRALQLTTNWHVTDENGYGRGVLSDSPHPLQLGLNQFSDVTLFLDYAAEILVSFYVNYPPQYISVSRWRAELATGQQPSEADFNSAQVVETNGLTFTINDDGHSYIYEVVAYWPDNNSFSTYAFRVVSTTAPTTGINLSIDNKSDELVSKFDNIYMFDFLPAFNGYWGGAFGDLPYLDENQGIVIWADQPLYNLQINMIDHSDNANETISNISAVLHEIDVLMPGTALFLSRFVIVGGIMPREGISFEDANGVRHYFAIADERRDFESLPPFFFIEFENGRPMFPAYTGTEQPPNVTPGILGSLAADFTWVVQPTLQYTNLHQCSCGSIVVEGWQHVDTATGLLLNQFCGHGGPPPSWVFDPQRGLFGHAGNFEGYHTFVGMHPMNEFEDNLNSIYGADNIGWILRSAAGFNIVETVDSSIQSPTEWHQGGWYLPAQAMYGTFALMYNYQFITDFIFNGGTRFRHNFEYVEGFPFMAMHVGGIWGLVDRFGNVVFPFMFENLVIIDGNTAFARYNGLYGILDIRTT